MCIPRTFPSTIYLCGTISIGDFLHTISCCSLIIDSDGLSSSHFWSLICVLFQSTIHFSPLLPIIEVISLSQSYHHTLWIFFPLNFFPTCLFSPVYTCLPLSILPCTAPVYASFLFPSVKATQLVPVSVFLALHVLFAPSPDVTSIPILFFCSSLYCFRVPLHLCLDHVIYSSGNEYSIYCFFVYVLAICFSFLRIICFSAHDSLYSFSQLIEHPGFANCWKSPRGTSFFPPPFANHWKLRRQTSSLRR